MEVIVEDISYENKLEHLNFSLPRGKMIGLTGDNKTLLLKILTGEIPTNCGKLKYDGKILSEENKADILPSIGFITQNPIQKILMPTVKEEIIYTLKRVHKVYKKERNHVIELFQMVGLTEEYLERDIRSLSSGELKLLQIALTLCEGEKQLLLLDEPFINLDFHHKREILKLLRDWIENNNITVLIASNDTDLLFANTDEIIVCKDGKILTQGTTYKTFQQVELLRQNQIDIPQLVEFTYKAKNEKQVRLTYHKDIRDLIKDIYRHVELKKE